MTTANKWIDISSDGSMWGTTIGGRTLTVYLRGGDNRWRMMFQPMLGADAKLLGTTDLAKAQSRALIKVSLWSARMAMDADKLLSESEGGR